MGIGDGIEEDAVTGLENEKGNWTSGAKGIIRNEYPIPLPQRFALQRRLMTRRQWPICRNECGDGVVWWDGMEIDLLVGKCC